MFQSRLTLFLLLLFIISCKDENKVEFTETNKATPNDPITPQISADNSSEKYPVQRKITGNKIKKTRTGKNIDTVYSPLFDKASQTFTIDQKNDTTLFCSEGTIIKISKSSLVFEDDDNKEPVEVMINVREYYKTDDIIFANLSTRAGDSILETGGMIFIEALSGLRKCKLKDGSQFEISFPYETRKENMELFTGSVKNGKIDWVNERIDFTCYYPVGISAEFPGGDAKLKQYLEKNIEYPDSLAERGINARLVVDFEIDSTGKVVNTAVRNSPDTLFSAIVQNTFSRMPKWKPAVTNGKPVSVRFEQQVNFISGVSEGFTYDPLYKSNFEKKVNDTNINGLQTAEIRQYLFSSTKLGWINCDRYYNDGKPRTDFYVKTAAYPGADVKIIFHRFNGILQGEKTSLGYVFKGVPVDEKITVLAIAKQKEKNFISLSESSTGSLMGDLNFEQVTMEVLKQRVAQLNDLRK
ncbi:MAG TPA: energy transducer TonB [Chitinophagaceae bacterium]|nr:energy transducer TonB [Chitinophagaceae bacterium]